MSYLLIGSHTSPFVRKIRLACHQRLDIELKTVNYFEEQGALELQTINPINKLPILIDGAQKIFDSRVIYNYLSHKHQWKALAPEEENLVSAIDAAADSCVNLFLLKHGGLDLAANNWYIQRQRERLPSILAYLKPWMQNLQADMPGHWYFPSMSLYSFLYWARFREMLDLKNNPECTQFLEAFKDKPGLAETDIPK